jgi:TPR repeat protein
MRARTHDDWLTVAQRQLAAGRRQQAFETTLDAARRGDAGAALNVGYFYDRGIGTRADAALAYRWYLEAHRKGDSSGTNNIGTLLRDQGHDRRALIWFRKAVRAGNADANLNLAQLHLARNEAAAAVRCLEAALRSKTITEGSREQAERSLRRIRRRPQGRAGRTSA